MWLLSNDMTLGFSCTAEPRPAPDCVISAPLSDAVLGCVLFGTHNSGATHTSRTLAAAHTMERHFLARVLVYSALKH